MLVRTIDVASYQPTDLTGLIAQYNAQQVIPHLYHDQESVPFSHSAAQVQSSKDNGCAVGGYQFPYPHQDMVRIVNSVMERCASIDLVLPLLWHDIETYEPTGEIITAQDLYDLVNQCDKVGAPCGLYVSKEMWRRMGNPTGFGHLPLWNAFQDDDPDFDFWLNPYGEWTDVAGEQYSGNPIDLSIFRSEYTSLGTQPETPGAPSAEPCADLIVALADVCDRIGDELATTPMPKKKRLKLVSDMRAIRTQFLGPR